MYLSLDQFKDKLLSMALNPAQDIQEIQCLIEEFLIHKAIPYHDLSVPFLIRCSPNNEGEVFNHISRCSYNPTPSMIPLQRANYPGQQVLYAAVPSKANQVTVDMTAVLETTMEKVKNKHISRCYLTLSRWHLNRPLKVFALPFTKRSAARNQDFKQMYRTYDKVLRELCNGNDSIYQYLKAFLCFVSEAFCHKNKKQIYYRISAAFYNAIMEISFLENFKIDGLIYPSANSKAEGMNIVLRKEVVDDQSISIDLVVTYVMQRNPFNPKDISFFYVSDGVRPDRNGKFSFSYIK